MRFVPKEIEDYTHVHYEPILNTAYLGHTMLQKKITINFDGEFHEKIGINTVFIALIIILFLIIHIPKKLKTIKQQEHFVIYDT